MKRVRERMHARGGAAESGAAPAPSGPFRLYFPQLEREIPCEAGESLFHAARRHGVRIVGACGGRGTCASCMVRVGAGVLRPHEGRGPQGFEIELDEAGHPLNPRRWMRACRIGARSDCTVEIGARSLAPVVRAEVRIEEEAGFAPALDCSPAVRVHELDVPVPTLADDRADADRVLDACRDREDAPRTVAAASASELAAVLRADGGTPCRLRAWQRGEALIAFAPSGRRSLGLAVDLGTTNLAAFLVDLDAGRTLARLGVENPQTAWGADLMSRIDHAIGDPALADTLRTAACEAIDALAHDLCASVGQRARDIVDVAVCGNTAMHHLLLGLPVRQLGRAPFVAAVRDSLDLTARELGLAVAPGAWVHVAPNIGGFIGGDHVAALLATESLWRAGACALVMDIGTNTEISLIHRGRLWSASSPSGPALEGGHIGCGMRAAEGAIEQVGLEGGRLVVRTIGGGEAVGLCGSGVLDTVAALRRGGLVDARGRLRADHPDIVTDEGGQRAARLAPEVLFTQADVRAVQLAKAAIRSCTELLLAEAGLAADSIERFVLAGAFGAYIDIASGIEIGLFPPLPRERFVQVGNAAGEGVRRLLLSCVERARARELARASRACALNARADFQKVFLGHIGFAPASDSASPPRLRPFSKNRHRRESVMNETNRFGIRIIGERINPGFKSTRAMFEDKDLGAIQALALKQVEAGAFALNVNIGPQAMTDRGFLVDVIRAIQDVVTVPLSFDVPTAELFALCLTTYDRGRAGGELAIVNSITEHRWEAMQLYRDLPFRVMVMASERVIDGVAMNNKTAEDIAATARRAALRLRDEYGMPLDHVFVDLSVSAIIADTEGLNRATLDAVRLIGADPDLKGLHMMGGLSNIGQQLPVRAADGSDLKHGLENAFLTLAVPYGFDTVLGTSWRGYAPLPEDDYVLTAYRNFLGTTGSNALRAVRKLYKA